MGKPGAGTIMLNGLWRENPIFRQILGICSALAVTNLLVNTVTLCAGMVAVTALSSGTVSLLRNVTPRRVRMMVQVLIIASYVILVDLVLKAYLPEISKALGPYVGLIITNCIIMGRAEAFAGSNRVLPSMLDGLASGLGYSLVLVCVAVVRELLGFGTIWNVALMPEDFTRWTLMVMAPGAFFMLGIFIWIARGLFPSKAEATGS
ncbi:MAG: electron transport complex subunit RsxE [Candidatus Alcyoniella australis]|nr:electron transport complex subunit RsxE [Candidatus Alcyoniella australis]